ncbi:MAG: sodium:solute symporter [Rhodothermus sp.]|nr:sodium:solute symporter [Rhodothermus sp.]
MITTLDYVVIGVYFAGLILLSYVIGRRFQGRADYFLGGRRMPAWAIGFSIIATQASVISMISAPAFVALRAGGGLQWLQYEFAVPLAMIPVAAILARTFHRAGIITVYEYLERRFGVATRLLFSLIFQLSRSLATGVAIYAAAILLSTMLETSLPVSILLVGGICLLYTTMGGIAADIWSDVIQLFVLWAGIFIVLAYAVKVGGGWDQLLAHVPADRLQAMDLTAHGLGDGATFGFWPMLLGGLFLYTSYYGCDQSQIQRVLSTPDEDTVRRTLFMNGIGRFPLVLSYILVGLLFAGFVQAVPSFTATIPADHPDYMIPLFIKHYVPPGITGILLAAMFAAVMSSIDSAFNALAATTVQDVYARYVRPQASDRHYLRVSRWLTVGWGVICTAFAFLAGRVAPTVIEGINKIGSVFYGPILAAFLLAILSRRATGAGVIAGLLAGVGVNLVLWLRFEAEVSWLWWNVAGCLTTLTVAWLFRGQHPVVTDDIHWGRQLGQELWRHRWLYGGLVLYFGLIVLVSALLGRIV